MQVIEQSPIYICDICGNRSTNKKDIEECELKGIEKPLCGIDTKVLFKDDSLEERLFNLWTAGLTDLHEYRTLQKALACGFDKGIELEVVEIIQNPHTVEYILGKDKNIIFGWSETFEHFDKYPHIWSNKDFNNKCTVLK